ncbi:hypothetical protein M2451_001202 [Dysgonomonas sp. PFB1-18]|uniref:hypothetical protein n=1 Tax=unclassified Dysgonomonas TaxID=2630389 RepID=UPI002476EC76|nr:MULTISPECIES: hypothetical protein [unclassified Dysgonomonas]MDH6308173.1 hypothetical protein [Dysgonomonas sp. PF1-14]MDH6338388.1 hypothetical protein [Dysgonomonas sp. PF1-16]MDH6379885.1 hypothetical protein [Dysgonomonas sp. PFB1-18]MDH6397025.1 hypothetical protein [Dysgonomonas sp. PF1-23]
MDLDNIKKTWQETEIKPDIGDDKIQKMISNEGKSAFNSLLKVEKFALFLMIPCLAIGVLVSCCMHLLFGIFYSVLVVGGAFWQMYKIKFLKQIDLSAMGILDVSKEITRYKKYIVKEIICGLILVLPLFFMYTYFVLPSMYPALSSPVKLAMLITGIGGTIIICYFVYKYLYIKNIRKVEMLVKENEEFDKEM